MQIYSEDKISPDRVQLSFDEHGYFFPIYPSPDQSSLLLNNTSNLSQKLKKFTTQTLKHEDLLRTHSPLKNGNAKNHKKNSFSLAGLTNTELKKRSPLREVRDLNLQD